MKKILLIVFAILQSFLISSCASVPDVPICKELELNRAYCIHTLSNKEYYVDDEHPFVNEDGSKSTWWDMRIKTISLPVQSWVKIRAFIVKQCKKNNQCSEITSWDRTVESVDKQFGE